MRLTLARAGLFTYGAKRGAYRLSAPVQIPYRAGKGYAWDEGSITFIQFPPAQPTTVVVRSQPDPKQNGHCRTFGPSPAMAATLPPSMGDVFRVVDLGVFPSTRVRHFDRKFRKPGGQPNEVEFLVSSVALKLYKAPSSK